MDTLLKDNRRWENVLILEPLKRDQAHGEEKQPEEQAELKICARHHSREVMENILTFAVIFGDYLMIISGFILASFICQSHWITVTGISTPTIQENYKLILSASALVLWRLRGKGLYLYKNLLAPSRIWQELLKALAICLSAFIGFTLVVQTEPPVSRRFIICAAVVIWPFLYGWRLVISQIVRQPFLASRLRRRVAVIGCGLQTLQVQQSLGKNSDLEFVGWVEAIKPNNLAELKPCRLGGLHELREILRRHAVDVAVLVESESLQREGVIAVTNACEIEHVQFNMVPHFFEVLVSGLRPENIAGMQLLGVSCLPLHGLRNRLIKRSVDIVGAMVGLALSIPLMAVFGALVFLESPGPIFYRQVRQGRSGRLFYIFKIRSMRLNAEADGKAKWACPEDGRRLRIGTFMRKWNIDEVPQFWNVLMGEMSLVGPRPERPELIGRFNSKIPHYQSRHMYQPGMTGWAQINGWRGNTCLEERIRHDIWYLENWSVWLDFGIMLRTFNKQKNAH